MYIAKLKTNPKALMPGFLTKELTHLVREQKVPGFTHPTAAPSHRISSAFLTLKRNQENSKGLWTGEKRVNQNDHRTLRINMLYSVLQQKDSEFLEIYALHKGIHWTKRPCRATG